MEPRYPGAVEEIINLGQHWDGKYLQTHREEIIKLAGKIKDRFQAAHKSLQEAGQLYEQSCRRTALQKRDQLLQELQNSLIEQIFKPEPARLRRFFSTAFTNKGPIDLKDELSRGYRRYILSGAPGSGGTQIIAALAQEAIKHGHQAELYHNSWTPPRPELLLLPELKVALLVDEGLQPHKQRPGDQLISLEHSEEPQQQLQSLLEKAGGELSAAKALHDDLEAYYRKAMDFDRMDESLQQLFNQILALTV